MADFNEYIALLHSGLSLLALPFDNTFKAYATPDGTLYSLTKRELNKMSFILPFDKGNFVDILNSNKKVRNKEIHSLSDLNMKVNEFAKRIIFINK